MAKARDESTLITYEQASELLEYRDGALFWKVSMGRAKAGDRAGSFNKSTGYRVIRVSGKRYKEHRLVWLLCKGEHPKNQIDHIDRNKTNNRIENLRDVSMSANLRNTKSVSKYTYVNYSASSDLWAAQISGDLSMYLGSYKYEIDAAYAAGHDVYTPRAEEVADNVGRLLRGETKGTSKYKGVCFIKPRKKWRAEQRVQGKIKHMGYFATELEAARAAGHDV